MSNGIFLPDAAGNFRFRESATAEERPVLTFERDTGVILFNFNLILLPAGRKLQDIIHQTAEGAVLGLVLTSTEMGPEEKKSRGLKA